MLCVHKKKKHKVIREGEPRTATSTFTQLFNSGLGGADDGAELNVLGCRLTYSGQTVTNVCVGRKALEGHLDFHTAPVLSYVDIDVDRFYIALFSALEQTHCTHM